MEHPVCVNNGLLHFWTAPCLVHKSHLDQYKKSKKINSSTEPRSCGLRAQKEVNILWIIMQQVYSFNFPLHTKKALIVLVCIYNTSISIFCEEGKNIFFTIYPACIISNILFAKLISIFIYIVLNSDVWKY